MIEQGDMVVYRCRGMYRVEKIGKLDFSGVDKKKDYFTLRSVENPKETVYVPAEEDKVRKPVTREQAMDLMSEVQEEEELWVPNERLREQTYKQCMASGDCRDWIRVLKTLYGRAKRRGTITTVDRKYQEIAEKALYSEFSYVLGMSENELREHVKNA